MRDRSMSPVLAKPSKIMGCSTGAPSVTERGGPMSTIGFHHLIQRLGEAARMPFQLHPHMLRHACGYKLANDGHDTRALQHYLGHKNIQHTVRYTELSPDRFRDFWRD
jgi:site-specific recombinase XerD